MILNNINGTIMAKALPIKRREMNEAFLSPRTLTRVFVPDCLSASTSSTSFVAVPPKRKSAEMVPIASGRFWNGFAKTLHDASTPRSPLGIATHSWLMKRNFFIRGGSEYVIEKNAMKRTSKLNVTLMASDNNIAKM